MDQVVILRSIASVDTHSNDIWKYKCLCIPFLCLLFSKSKLFEIIFLEPTAVILRSLSSAKCKRFTSNESSFIRVHHDRRSINRVLFGMYNYFIKSTRFMDIILVKMFSQERKLLPNLETCQVWWSFTCTLITTGFDVCSRFNRFSETYSQVSNQFCDLLPRFLYQNMTAVLLQLKLHFTTF